MSDVSRVEQAGGCSMLMRLNRFRRDDKGAVTVDYVVLVAALIGLGLSVVNAVKLGTFEARDDIVKVIKDPAAATCGAGDGGSGVGGCGAGN